MGGGISSAVARAWGAGRRDEADALVLHAIVVNIALGGFFSIVMLVFGPSIYNALGGRAGGLHTALSYSNVVFAGNVLLWLMNALASVIRGTGNMLVPATVVSVGVVVFIGDRETSRAEFAFLSLPPRLSIRVGDASFWYQSI